MTASGVRVRMFCRGPLLARSEFFSPLRTAVFFILFALADGEKHGYAIMQQTRTLSDDRFRMGPGTLYTTIQRLLELALIQEVLDSGERESRRRYYRLTRQGRALLD